ncbi:cytochrome P450 [Nocardia sp. NPDC060259]|uniref:cytochrome P450 n=1 Tax=Nocardia sp. NPDC060259 TaxID=3347088 RepID=UPI003658000F
MYRTLVHGLERRAAQVLDLYPATSRPLAAPPPDSGLLPVPGDPGAPLVGRTLTMLTEPLEGARAVIDKYGAVSWTNLLGRPYVLATGPEALEALWMNRDKAFSSEKGFEWAIGPFFRRGVLLLDFEEHTHHRRILQQAFTRQRLISYLELLKPGIERELDAWQPGADFPAYSHVKAMLLHLASEVFVGTELGAESAKIEQAFVSTLEGGQALVRTNVPGGKWSRGLRGRRTLQKYFREQLPAKRAGNDNDLFSVLCRARSQDGRAFTDDDVVNHMIFTLMAAHDTSALALSMFIMLLGKHPQWQQRLRAESIALGKPVLDYDDIEQLASMDLAFRETLRMYAPAGTLFRQAIRDTELLGYHIPAGTDVMIGAFPTMRNERWWARPDEFDPERFAEHRREDRSHKMAWAPFGGGAHKCIGLYFGGMTVKSVMHRLLLNFEWSVPADYEPPLAWGTGPIPMDGGPITLRRRTAGTPPGNVT